MKSIILASSSPRRAVILEQVGIDFTVQPSDFDEDSVRIDDPIDFVKTLAYKKAESIPCQDNETRLILAADTVVVIDNQILGKPHNDLESKKYLKEISGREHKVYTGVCIRDPKNNRFLTKYQETTVVMDSMSTQDIDFYVSTKEPFDKAGAYGIQGIGARYVKEIKGDFYNVVGLPINLCIHMLKEMGDVHEGTLTK